MTTADPNSSDKTIDDPVQDLWQFSPLAQFEKARPQEPTQEAVRHGLRALWQRLPFNRTAPETPETPEAARFLTSAPTLMMERAAPSPDWQSVGSLGLDQALSSWLEGGAEAGSRAIVAAPASCVDQMVRAWAQDHGLDLLAPPSQDAILSGQAWLDELEQRRRGEDAPRRFVLTGLEHCYLRHPAGLDLVRQLLDLIWRQEIVCLLTCDSWAWAYLNRLLHVESVLPAPLVLSPLDVPALSTWFRSLADQEEPRHLTFRQANNGRPILAPADRADAKSSQDDEKSAKDTKDQEFLVHLAALSRGNPGVGWAIWRESLLVRSDEDEEVDAKAQAEADADRGYTMWVRTWAKVELPKLPTGTGREAAFVLHALLLHNGLPSNLLPALLPLDRAEVVHILQTLRSARLVVNPGDHWYVSPAGYPAVRSFLDGEGFLIDVL